LYEVDFSVKLKIYWHKNCYVILVTTCGLSKFDEQYSQ